MICSLINSGYDLFPFTTDIQGIVSTHVETVCLLVLRNPVTHINIDVDVEEMVQDKKDWQPMGKSRIMFWNKTA